MKIELDKIPAGGRFLEAQESVEAYNLATMDFVFRDPICIAVGAQVVTGNLMVSGKIRTKIHMKCSRCLKEFTRDWEDTAYRFDCEVSDPHQTIDLTENIREDIIIGLPVKPLCKQDCKGLCRQCGVDRNGTTCACPSNKEDVRWSDLNKLKWE